MAAENREKVYLCVVKIYLRMLIFTHQIYQQSWNYTDSRLILKEIELFWATWFEILLEYPRSWCRNKVNPERSVIQIRKNFPLKVPVFESNSSMIL